MISILFCILALVIIGTFYIVAKVGIYISDSQYKPLTGYAKIRADWQAAYSQEDEVEEEDDEKSDRDEHCTYHGSQA